jgi:signal transduction histidine kinase
MPRYIIHLIFALAALCAVGCEAGVLPATVSKYKISGTDIAILRDAGGTLSADELERPDIAARFMPLKGPPQLGYAKDVVWLRLSLQRLEDAPRSWILAYSNPYINDLRLYSRSASGFTVAQAGDQYAFAGRALKSGFPAFELAFPDASPQTFYLRMDTDSSLAGELVVWQPDAWREHVQLELFYFGAVLGMICMSFLISIVHWLYSRERQILLFAMLTVTTFLMVAAGLGLFAPVFAPTRPAIADLMVPWSLALSTVAVGVVFGHALNMRADFPRLHQFFRLAYLIALAAPWTRNFNLYNVWGGPMLQLDFLLVVFSTGWVSWLRWRSKALGAGYFFAAHMTVIGSMFTGRLMLLGLLPTNSVTELNWIPGVLTFLFLAHAGIFVASQAVKQERDAAFAAAKTASEVLVSERKLREEQTVFFSFVAHELRSPLAAVLTGVKNLENEWAEVPEKVRVRTQRIKTYAERMGSLIDRHLTLQRLNDADFQPRFSPCNPRHIAQECLGRVRPLFGDRAFAVDYAAGLPASVSVDPELLHMGLENLLINAAKFSPADSAITLDVFADAALHLRVSDRGPGIQAEQLGRLFSLFNRVQQAGYEGGFGIGLAITRRVAIAHGGNLDYTDRAGGGAVFTLSLPING